MDRLAALNWPELAGDAIDISPIDEDAPLDWVCAACVNWWEFYELKPEPSKCNGTLGRWRSKS